MHDSMQVILWEWVCTRCTFSNECSAGEGGVVVRRRRCEMCDSPAPQ
jgi:hypothetical protein